MGDNPEGKKRCPGFAQCSRGQESLESHSSHPRGHLAVPPGLSLCAQGRCDQHLIDLLLLWTQAGMQLGFLGQKEVRMLFFLFP